MLNMFFEMCRCFPFRLVPSPFLWGPQCFKISFKICIFGNYNPVLHNLQILQKD